MSDKKPPEAFAYDFLEGEDDGIFKGGSDPVGSYGDKDAIEDLNARGGVGPIMFSPDENGIPGPAPDIDMMALATAPARVGTHEMMCLVGPCKHYVEQKIRSGYREDNGEPTYVTDRFCLRLKTWAEPLQLGEIDIYVCSGHTMDAIDSEDTYKAACKNDENVKLINDAANAKEGHDLGVCHSARCRHYIMMQIGRLDATGEIKREPHRYCTLLAGAARMREIFSYTPVKACTGLDSALPRGCARTIALLDNDTEIEESRKIYENREGQDG